MNESSANSNDSWEACPPGELSRMVARTQSQRQRATMVKIAGTTVAVLLVAVLIGTVVSRWATPQEYRFGNIACSEVQPILDDYRHARLDPAIAEQIRIHLAECPHCGKLYRRMNTAGEAVLADDTPLSLAMLRPGPSDLPVHSH